MKHFRITEPVMWAFLIVGALIGAIIIGWQLQTDWNELPVTEQRAILEKSEVEKIADTFMQEHFSIDTSSFRVNSVITSTSLPDTFLSKSNLSKSDITSYRDEYLNASQAYSVRFFKEFEIEEYNVKIDAYRGDVISFYQIVSEDKEIIDELETVNFSLSLPEEDVAKKEVKEEMAIDLARNYVAYNINVTPESLSIHNKSEKNLPNRIDRIISFSWSESEVDSEYGKGFVVFDTVIRGNNVVSFDKSFKYPEAYERELTRSNNIGMSVGLVSVLAWLFIIISALVVMIKSFSKHTAIWRLSLGTVIVIGVLSIIELANGYPVILSLYDTSDSMMVHWIFFIVVTVFATVLLALSFFAPSVAGNTIAAENFKDRMNPLFSLPTSPETKKQYREALIRGYLLGVFFLGFTFALYWLGEKYFEVSYPFGDMISLDILNSFVPAFTLMLSFGIIASIVEEITFRLFGILWLSKITKSTILGVLIATLVWAFAHTDGSVLPVWFRGMEVFIGGLLFAYFFIRYNILTTIIAHYVHNIIIACVLLLFTFGRTELISALLIFAMPAIVYFIFEWSVDRKSKGTI